MCFTKHVSGGKEDPSFLKNKTKNSFVRRYVLLWKLMKSFRHLSVIRSHNLKEDSHGREKIHVGMDSLFWGNQQSFSSMYFIGLVDPFDMRRGACGHLKNKGEKSSEQESL